LDRKGYDAHTASNYSEFSHIDCLAMMWLKVLRSRIRERDHPSQFPLSAIAVDVSERDRKVI